MNFLIPGISGLVGALVMTLFLRRARYLGLPETQMIRAIGSFITKDIETALWPGFFAHLGAGIFWAYIYAFMLSYAPTEEGHVATVAVVCALMGLVQGLMVNLFLEIAVAQYHPVEEFRKIEPRDMAAHVVSHITYGATVGFLLGYLPKLMG